MERDGAKKKKGEEKKDGMVGATGLESSEAPESSFIVVIVDETGTAASSLGKVTQSGERMSLM